MTGERGVGTLTGRSRRSSAGGESAVRETKVRGVQRSRGRGGTVGARRGAGGRLAPRKRGAQRQPASVLGRVRKQNRNCRAPSSVRQQTSRRAIEGAVVASTPIRRRTVWYRECEILRSVGGMAYRSGPTHDGMSALRRVTTAFGTIATPSARHPTRKAARRGCRAALDGWPLPHCFPRSFLHKGNEYPAE